MKIHSKIDSDRFGVKIGRITDEFLAQVPVHRMVDYFRDNEYDLIIARISGQDISTINELEQRGFTYKDAQTTLSYDLVGKTKEDLPLQKAKSITRDFKFKDMSDLLFITAQSFTKYGHYFEDKRLREKDTLDAYVDWVYNSCAQSGVVDKIIVAELHNCVIGYLTFKIYETGNDRYAAGGIGAVYPPYRGLGVFRDITIQGLKWGIEQGLKWEEHNVLSTNFPVNRSFLKLGFKPKDFVITLHGWVDSLKN